MQKLDGDEPASSMTAREYIAVHAMVAIISKNTPQSIGVDGLSGKEAKKFMESIAHGAVLYADCLIAELQRTE